MSKIALQVISEYINVMRREFKMEKEDMHDGLIIENKLKIKNPFV